MTVITNPCRRCRAAPVIAVGLCRRCGLREAHAERDRRNRAERRQQAQERRARRWQPPVGSAESEDAA